MANNRASDLIEAALNEALKEDFADREEGDLVQEWVLIAFCANPDPDKGDGYPILFSNGRMPTHTARGLLHTGLRSLNEEED